MRPLREPRNKALLVVSAAALFDRQARVLLCQRPEGKKLAGFWEFPGGKIEPDESAEGALVRELAEELGLAIDPKDLTPLTFASHAYDSFYLLMPVFACTVWRGIPTAREHTQIEWTDVDALDRYPMPPADLPILPAIKTFSRTLRISYD